MHTSNAMSINSTWRDDVFIHCRVAKWSKDSCSSLPIKPRSYHMHSSQKLYLDFLGVFCDFESTSVHFSFLFSFLLFVCFHRWMVTNNVWNNAYWCHITRQWAKCKFLLWNWQTKETIRPKEISATKMLVVIVWFHCEHTIVRNVSWLCTIGRASARFPFIPVALLIRSWFVCASDRSGFLTHTHNAHAPFQKSYDQEKQCFGLPKVILIWSQRGLLSFGKLFRWLFEMYPNASHLSTTMIQGADETICVQCRNNEHSIALFQSIVSWRFHHALNTSID